MATKLKYCGKCDCLTDHTDKTCMIIAVEQQVSSQPKGVKSSSCSSTSRRGRSPPKQKDVDSYDEMDGIQRKPVQNVEFWECDDFTRFRDKDNYIDIRGKDHDILEMLEDGENYVMEDVDRETTTKILNLYMDNDKSYMTDYEWMTEEKESDSNSYESDNKESDDCHKFEFDEDEFISFDYDNVDEEDGIRLTVGETDVNDYTILVEKECLKDFADFLRKMAYRLDNI